MRSKGPIIEGEIYSLLSKKLANDFKSLTFLYEGLSIEVLPPIEERGILNFIDSDFLYINSVKESKFRIESSEEEKNIWNYFNESKEKEIIEFKTALRYLYKPWLVKNPGLGNFIDDTLGNYFINEFSIIEKQSKEHSIIYEPLEGSLAHAELKSVKKELNLQRALIKFDMSLDIDYKIIKTICI